jgi:hypothetical protein
LIEKLPEEISPLVATSLSMFGMGTAGVELGMDDGSLLGPELGLPLGDELGLTLGEDDGSELGDDDGTELGMAEGVSLSVDLGSELCDVLSVNHFTGQLVLSYGVQLPPTLA